MNKKLIIIGLSIIFITIAFSGCIDFSENPASYLMEDYPSGEKVEVTVLPKATVKRYDDVEGLIPVSGATVTFTIRKTGGETFTFTQVTDQNGIATTPQVGYNLYRGQKVTVEAKGPGDSSTTVLTYQTAYDYKSEYNTFAWAPSAILYTG